MKNEISSNLLVWLTFGVCVLAAMWARPSYAAIKCYENGNEEDLLQTVHPKGYRIKECASSTNKCYESYEKTLNPKDQRAVYKAGCIDSCNRATEICSSCSTALCNDRFFKKIAAVSRQCWGGGKGESFGDETFFCFPNVTKCYVGVVGSGEIHEKIFHAGCGTREPDGFSFHYVCEFDLCNLPYYMSEVIRKKRRKLPARPPRPSDEDTEPLTTPKPTDKPTPEPTDKPTPEPTDKPTPMPTDKPTDHPTDKTIISAPPVGSALKCFHNAGDEDFGVKTVNCLHSVAKCYYQGYDIGNNMVRYNAGCGICDKCGGKCFVCNTNLCNVPPELENAVLQRQSQQQSVSTGTSDQTKDQSVRDNNSQPRKDKDDNGKKKGEEIQKSSSPNDKKPRGKYYDYGDFDNSSAAKTVMWGIVAVLPLLVVVCIS